MVGTGKCVENESFHFGASTGVGKAWKEVQETLIFVVSYSLFNQVGSIKA